MTAEDVAAQLAIRDLIARYNQTGDAEDADGYAATFAPDGVIEVFGEKYVGREAIHAWKAGRNLRTSSAPGPVFRRHNVTTTRITLNGPHRASGLVYWMVMTAIMPEPFHANVSSSVSGSRARPDARLPGRAGRRDSPAAPDRSPCRGTAGRRLRPA